jgi:hypothetical protein
VYEVNEWGGLTSDMGNYIPAVPATSYRSQPALSERGEV